MSISDPSPSSQSGDRMRDQLSGFRGLARFRRFGYQIVAVGAFIWGVAAGARQGLHEGLVTALLGALFGIAGVRLLSAPVGAILWYRKWRCPACQKHLGLRYLETCPNCGTRILEI